MTQASLKGPYLQYSANPGKLAFGRERKGKGVEEKKTIKGESRRLGCVCVCHEAHHLTVSPGLEARGEEERKEPR